MLWPHDWLACLALVRALGRRGRREVADFWRRLTPWERRLLVSHLLSDLAQYAEHQRRRESSDRGRQVMAAGGRVALQVGDLTDEEIALIARSERKNASGGKPEA
jgi:hypothetical protein